MATIDDINGKISSLENYLKDIDTGVVDFICEFTEKDEKFVDEIDKKLEERLKKEVGQKIDAFSTSVLASLNSNNSGATQIQQAITNALTTGNNNVLDTLRSIESTVLGMSNIMGGQNPLPNPQGNPSNPPTNPISTSFEQAVDKIKDSVESIFSLLHANMGNVGINANTTTKQAKQIGKKRAISEVTYETQLKELRKREADKRWNALSKKEKFEARLTGKDKSEYGRGGDSGSNIADIIAKKVVGTVATVAKGNIDSSAAIDKGIGTISSLGPVGGIIGSIMSLIKMGFDVYGEQSKLGSQFARTIGGNGFGQKEFIKRGNTFVNNNSRWNNNYKINEVSDAVTSFSQATGRNGIRQTDTNIKSAIDLKRMGIEADALNGFDTFGRSIEETDKYFTKLYGQAGKKGLSFSNVSKAVKDNLKMAQSYTFASGVNGLMRMAETSTQLKYNMNEVARIAEKVSTVEGALSSAASLSVLGGDFAKFGNPMSLLYEGLNDMEGLNERMISMFGDMAQFDKKKGQIDISAFNRQRIKAASQALGVDANEMISLAMNKERGNIVENQLGGGLDNETVDYIKNLAQLDKNGNAYISGENGEKRYVKDLTSSDKDYLKHESDRKNTAENSKIGDVYNSTRNMYDKLNQIMNYLSTKLGVWVAKIAGINIEKSNKITSDERRAFADHTGKFANYDEKQFNELHETYGYGRSWRKAMRRGAFDSYITSFNEDAESKHPMGIIPGESHLNGGVPARYRGKPIEIEGGEALINKLSVQRYGVDFIRAINNGSYSPYSQISNGSNPFKQMSFAGSKHENQTVGAQKISFDPIKIDISGDLNLKYNGNNIGKINANDIITPQFIDMLTKEIQKKVSLGGFDKENFHTRMAIN